MFRFLSILFFSFSAFIAHAQIVRQWVATYNGQGDYNDRITCMVADQAGNYYLGGSAVNPANDRDFLIVKITPSGDTIWTYTQDGNDHAADEVFAMALDNAGNIVATGLSKGDNTSEDFLTIKLTSGGQKIWGRRYDYIGEYDQPNAVAVDSFGNVIVTGLSDGDGTSTQNDDYLTVKYNSGGDLLWAKRYDGLGNATDRAVAVAINRDGRIFVTGRSDNGINDDYATIAYDTSGNQIWIRLDDRGERDRATAMQADIAGNLLITGQSSNGDNDDFWTLKYQPDGVLLWQKVYDFVDDDRAAAITVGYNGNVYVAGQSDQVFGTVRNWDYATVAYGPGGNQLWEKRFDGVESEDEYPSSVAFEPLSNRVFVTGRSDNDIAITTDNEIVTLCYDGTNGTEYWVNAYAPLLNRDHVGNVVAGLGNGGCLIAGYAEDSTAFRDALWLKYDAFGGLEWQKKYAGLGDNYDAVRQVSVDGAGNVWAVGYTISSTDNRNMMLARFTPDGDYDCRYVENGSAASAVDEGQFIVQAGDGHPLSAGFVKNAGSGYDIFMLKSDSLCDPLWSKNINGNANGSERAYDMVRDGKGNILLTGRSDLQPGPAENDAVFTCKISEADGQLLWIQKFDTSLADRGVVMRIDSTGNYWIAGRSFDGLEEDVFLLQYSETGQLLKYQPIAMPGNDIPVDMELTQDGHIILLLNSETADSNHITHSFLLYFDGQANEMWRRPAAAANTEEDFGKALALSPDQAIIVAVDTDDGVQKDISLTRFESDQTMTWTASPGGPSGDDLAEDMAVDSAGRIYMTGRLGNGDNASAFVSVHDHTGTLVWIDQYDGPVTNGYDTGSDILLVDDGFVVGGSSEQPGSQRDMLLLRYTGAIVPAIDVETPEVAVYPNPFETLLHIGNTSAASFTLFDARGTVVLHTTLDPVAGTSNIAMPPLAAGVYFYQVNLTGGFIRSGRLIHL